MNKIKWIKENIKSIKGTQGENPGTLCQSFWLEYRFILSKYLHGYKYVEQVGNRLFRALKMI